jgi:hypothetical protein
MRMNDTINLAQRDGTKTVPALKIGELVAIHKSSNGGVNLIVSVKQEDGYYLFAQCKNQASAVQIATTLAEHLNGVPMTQVQKWLLDNYEMATELRKLYVPTPAKKPTDIRPNGTITLGFDVKTDGETTREIEAERYGELVAIYNASSKKNFKFAVVVDTDEGFLVFQYFRGITAARNVAKELAGMLGSADRMDVRGLIKSNEKRLYELRKAYRDK